MQILDMQNSTSSRHLNNHGAKKSTVLIDGAIFEFRKR